MDPHLIALDVWKSHVFDPAKSDKTPAGEACREDILNMIQNKVEGLGWHWIKVYSGDGAFAWCGAFAAHCWQKVRPEIREKCFASTLRLWDFGAENTGRRVKSTDLQPGDIVTVGDGAKGSHIVIFLNWDKNKTIFTCIEGNGHGRFPDGSWGEGVVMGIRERSDIRAGYRPLEGDLING